MALFKLILQKIPTEALVTDGTVSYDRPITMFGCHDQYFAESMLSPNRRPSNANAGRL